MRAITIAYAPLTAVQQRIAGVSDLNLLLQEALFFTGYRFAREQIGLDKEKLRSDSPLRHVDGG